MKLKLAVLIAFALCAGACFSSPASRFYMLNSIQDSGVYSGIEAERNTMSICVGPVLLAEYLDRKQICTREQGPEVTYAEYHRWAEPLNTGVVRVLVENLSQLLNTARIDVFPWKSPAPADYQVRIMLVRFNGESDGQAMLKARWSLEAEGQEKPVFDTMTSIVEQAESGSYEDLVKAQSRALEKLSFEIAAAIQREAVR
jgi:uncharacterized lipoprotein YmbA